MSSAMVDTVLMTTVATAIAVAVYVGIQAQERDRPYPPTRTWQIPDTEVYVTDTAGVCIYVGYRGAIAVVPKTQLPAGAGCQ